MLITSQSEQLWISELSIHGLLSVPSTHCDLKYVNKLLDISLFKNGDEFPSCRLNLSDSFFLKVFLKKYTYLAVLGLGCSTWNLLFVATCEIFSCMQHENLVVTCGI